jgi:5-methyltetrahydrofolate--homocysteine methyltransferase
MFDLSLLSQAIVSGDREKTIQLTKEALGAGTSPPEIITEGLQAGMSAVGEKFSSGEYFLPDMLMSARAMQAALEILNPSLEKTGMPTIGRVVIGTVAEDIHDIGKNIVATFLKGSGFEVFDLGVDVPDEKFVDEVREKKPDILGLSALVTTTMPAMGNIIKSLEEAGLRSKVKVIVGGAPVTQHFAEHIGADAFADDGGQAISVCKRLLGK